jgi:hypothetical protein
MPVTQNDVSDSDRAWRPYHCSCSCPFLFNVIFSLCLLFPLLYSCPYSCPYPSSYPCPYSVLVSVLVLVFILSLSLSMSFPCPYPCPWPCQCPFCNFSVLISYFSFKYSLFVPVPFSLFLSSPLWRSHVVLLLHINLADFSVRQLPDFNAGMLLNNYEVFQCMKKSRKRFVSLTLI